MARPTYWPLRQALSFALKHIIASEALPAINADLLARAVTADPARVPQFGDAQLVIGDVAVPSEPTLCIVGIARRNSELAAGSYLATLTTQVRLKTPWFADNAPEDFELIRGIIEDNLEDLLTSLAHRAITPANPVSGKGLLPLKSDGSFMSFQECTSLGSNVMSYPVRAADRVTTYAGWMLMHSAQIDYALSRPGVVGTD